MGKIRQGTAITAMQGQTVDKRLNFGDLLNQKIDESLDDIRQLASLLKARKLTIATVESITGGGIARKIVETPGCSDYFLGAFVAYNARMKIQYSRVLPKTIADYGLISAPVTEEMAAGIKKMTQADITIASNGIAGPINDTFSADQSGTVFLSWNIRDKIIKTKRFKLEGGRNEVIDKAVFVALSMCLNYLKNDLRKDV